MGQRTGIFIKSMTVSGIAVSALLGLATTTFTAAPAQAVIYCTYVGYPVGCVARAGVVLRPQLFRVSRSGGQFDLHRRGQLVQAAPASSSSSRWMSLAHNGSTPLSCS